MDRDTRDMKSHYDNLEAWLRVEREAEEIQTRNNRASRGTRAKNQNLKIFEKQVLKKQR